MSLNVYSLPAEVICQIFLYLSSDSPCVYTSLQYETHGTEPIMRRLGWFFAVSHTCRKWRAFAVGLSELWANNLCFLQSEEATNCFMERAKESSELVFISRPDTRVFRREFGKIYEFHVRLAEANIGRVKIFKQETGYTSISSSFVEALCAAPRPKLVDLHIHRWHGLDRNLVVDGFSLNAPALQELSLDAVLFTVNAPNLRVFKFKAENGFHGGLRGVTESQLMLHSILRTTPLLEQLTLEYIFELNDWDDAEDSDALRVEAADLSRLRSLRILTHGSGLCPFNFVNPAPNTDIHVDIRHATVEHGLSHTFEAMRSRMRHPALDTLVLSEGADSRLNSRSGDFKSFGAQVHLYSSASCHKHGSEQGGPQLRIRGFVGRMIATKFTWLGLIQAILPYVNIENIKFLDLGGVGEDRLVSVNIHDVRNTLALFTGVTTVQVGAFGPSGTHTLPWCDPGDIDMRVKTTQIHLPAIGHTSTGGDAQASALPLPALQHLIIEDFHFETMWARVRAVLEERKRAGHAVRYLTLPNHFPSELLGTDERHDAVRAACAEGLVEQVFDRGVWVNMQSGAREDCPRVSKEVEELGAYDSRVTSEYWNYIDSKR